MGADWAAGLLGHPIAIASWLGLVLLLTFAFSPKRATPPVISRRQILLGYVGITVVCLLLSAWGSYVSPEEALAVWKVPPERYWSATLNEFLVHVTLLSFISLLGAALMGVPAVVALSRRGLATVPWVLAASIFVSLLLALVLVALGAPSPNTRFTDTFAFVVGTHLALSFGFCVGARLQWRLRQNDAQT